VVTTQYGREATDSSSASVGDLLAEVSSDLSTLMRQELDLAKAELRQSATRAGRGAGLLTGAAIAALLFLIFVSVAVWWALGNSIGRGWSALIVALAWLIIGALLAVAGRSQLKSVSGLSRTADTVKRIPNAVQGNEELS
jgi:tetrahydromethanopterin S-methyltransferase subunit G